MEPHNNGTLNLNELCEQSPNDLSAPGAGPPGTATTANGKLSNGKMYSYVANTDAETDLAGVAWRPRLFGSYRGGGAPGGGTETMDSIQNRKLPELPKTPESTGSWDAGGTRVFVKAVRGWGRTAFAFAPAHAFVLGGDQWCVKDS